MMNIDIDRATPGQASSNLGSVGAFRVAYTPPTTTNDYLGYPVAEYDCALHPGSPYAVGADTGVNEG